MPRQPTKKIEAKDIQGLKYLRVLEPLLESLLESLHKVGTERDSAGNRKLHMDHYCMMVLLWLYSPLISSLRSLHQASQLEKVQRKFKIPKAALGTLSEAVHVFDPEPLKRIAEELGQQLRMSYTR